MPNPVFPNHQTKLDSLQLQHQYAQQSADPFQVLDPSGNILFNIMANGAGAVRVAYARYNFAVDGGADSLITPAVNTVIPANAIVFGAFFNPTTAPVGSGASIAFGTSAGSSATSLKAATAITTFTIDSIIAAVPVFTAASAFKMSAAGSITMTPSAAVLTAGVIEVFVFYVVAVGA